MTDKPGDTTQANHANNPDSGGKPSPGAKRPADARTVTEVNEAANAEFNADETTEGITETRVGGLHGSPD